MQNKLRTLLLSWCEYLLRMQITDPEHPDFGGFRCEACAHIHGRADNAVYPLTCAYVQTGDERFLQAAENVLIFRRRLTHPDGAVQNDFGSEWKGITVFSAIALYKTLRFRESLPLRFTRQVQTLFEASANWVYENVVPGFRANINYYAAACAVNAMAGRTDRAQELLDYCLAHFTDNGWITGEGQPHDFRTEKGCAPIDVGYVVEETMPCLVDAAVCLGDEDALREISRHMRKQLRFMLPDGGWDNSFGVRCNKWTYYGSRTSDGCIGALAELGKQDGIFYEAARRTYAILERCTVDGALYGGLQYSENGQPPCVHHTFCHAVSLADALCTGIGEGTEPLPCDTVRTAVDYYPELDTTKIRIGPWLATVTGFDYSTYTYGRGAAHTSGHTLSLLWHRKMGPVIAGSMYEYKQTELYNMQLPQGVNHRTLIPRAEFEQDGEMYATCLDGGADFEVYKTNDTIRMEVCAGYCSVADQMVPSVQDVAQIVYIFTEKSVQIHVHPGRKDARFVLPILRTGATIRTANAFTREPIFYLTGGFAAEEYTFLPGQIIHIEIIGGENNV